MNTIAYISLGSNLEHPITQLNIALTHIAKIPQTRMHLCSAFYHTKPIGYINQPHFVNAVVAVQTSLSAHELLYALQAIEEQQGRTRLFKNGPRTIDLDLLLHGSSTINDPELTLPHPRMTERAFVLKPLADIAPTLILHDGQTVLVHLAKQGNQDVEKVETPYA